MSARTAAIVGSTGMIGTSLLRLLLDDPTFGTVRILVRRPTPKTHPKMEVKLVDFYDAESVKLALEGVHSIFSCTGTTRSQVKGDMNLYRHIDLGIPVNVARYGKEAGADTFVTVTAIGANPRSKNFYLKLKGETEELLQTTGVRSVQVMEPSMLTGDRQQNRPMEKFMQVLMRPVSALLFGHLRKYRSIDGDTVAKAMLGAAKEGKPGFHRHTYDDMMRLSRI